jgi:hypothetical protein
MPPRLVWGSTSLTLRVSVMCQTKPRGVCFAFFFKEN